MKQKLKLLFLGLAVASTLQIQLSTVFAQGTAFIYQGQLTEGGSPANGSYDLTFALFDAASGGAQQGGTLTNNAIGLSNGLFAVTLDFGPVSFNGAGRWLEIGVRPAGNGTFANLTPRQPIAATPYAIFTANSGSAAALSGTLSAGQLTGLISSNNIGAGSITKVMLAEGAVTTTALADAAVTPLKVATSYQVPLTTTITNPSPLDSEAFGFSVEMVGSDRVLIGTPYENTGGAYSGAAYLFQTNGTLLTTITNPAPAAGDYFGWSGVAVGGDRILIGAPDDSIGATADGAAYMFSTNGTLLTTFTNPTPAFNESFGQSLATLGSDRVLIGASGDNAGGAYAGAAYLFHTNGTLLTTFKKPSPTANEYFGRSVAVVGTDRVLIGAPDVSIGASHAGAAYLFRTNGVLLTTFTNPVPAIGDWFGGFLTVVGSDRLLIGARGKAVGGQGVVGAAYLLSTNGTLLTTFTNPSPAFSDQFGFSVAAAGSDRVLIGAIGDDTAGDNAGAAYLFSTSGTLLATITNPIPREGAFFGYSAAAPGNDRVFIGAAGATGVVYQFSLESYAAGLVAESVRSGAITSASLADGAVTAAKLDPAIGLWSASGQNVYRASGGVGINTTNPAYTLDVNGTAHANTLLATVASSDLLYNSTMAEFFDTTQYGSQYFGPGLRQMIYLNPPSGFLGPMPGIGLQTNNVYFRSLGEFSWFRNGGHSNISHDPGSVFGLPGTELMRLGGGYLQVNGNGNEQAYFGGDGAGGDVEIGSRNAAIMNVGFWNSAAFSHMNVYALSFTPTSDRNAKENFQPLDSTAVLAKVVALPLTEWNYKADAATKHIGPMAQDFYAAFGVGPDDKHIATVDADGVALAAIQGLNEKVENGKRKAESQIAELRAENAELKARLVALERLVARTKPEGE